MTRCSPCRASEISSLGTARRHVPHARFSSQLCLRAWLSYRGPWPTQTKRTAVWLPTLNCTCVQVGVKTQQPRGQCWPCSIFRPVSAVHVTFPPVPSPGMFRDALPAPCNNGNKACWVSSAIVGSGAILSSPSSSRHWDWGLKPLSLSLPVQHTESLSESHIQAHRCLAGHTDPSGCHSLALAPIGDWSRLVVLCHAKRWKLKMPQKV